MKPADLRKSVGQTVKLNFASEVRVLTQIRAVLPKKGPARLVVCGPADVQAPDGASLGHFESFIFVASRITAITEVWKRSDPRLRRGQLPSTHQWEED
jgi:hypothetical protein